MSQPILLLLRILEPPVIQAYKIPDISSQRAKNGILESTALEPRIRSLSVYVNDV